MTRLSYRTLSNLPDNVITADIAPASVQVGIVHLGPGAFHRAHQAMYTQQVDKDGCWGISAVSLRSGQLKDALQQQNNLYTLMILDDKPQTAIVSALKEVLVLEQDRAQVMARMTSPQTHIISLTITEKGYCLNNDGSLNLEHPDIRHDLAHPDNPISAIGLLTAALKQRKHTNTGDVTVISCDNLPDNGDTLHGAVTLFADQSDTALSQWIADSICFPNTMVDSITPASDDALQKAAEQVTGLEDAWPVQREAFTQWVIEDKFSGPRPGWEASGAIITHDVQVFEKAKLRILNGSHTALAYLGSLCHLNTVYEAVTHDAMHTFLNTLLHEEILPSVDASDALNPGQYAADILKRFKNRHIHHLLSQIAWDGSQKLPPRILQTLRDNLAANRSIALLSATVAAWILFVVRASQSDTKIIDPMGETLHELVKTHNGHLTNVADALLDDKRIFGELSQNTAFRNTVHSQLRIVAAIDSQNVSQQLAALCQ